MALVYPLIISLSGFLLFLVQPMMGKIALPTFGGTSAVWSTCVLFFQAALLIGYLYAFGLTRLPLRWQAGVHLCVVALAALFVPAALESYTLSAEGTPSLAILGFLARTIGVPYMLLATTSTVVQFWFGHRRGKSDPAVLFAVSNAASFGGLLSYPFLFERIASTHDQLRWWSAGFLAYIGLVAVLGVATLLARPADEANPASAPVQPDGRLRPLTVPRAALALLLAFLGSVMLLAVTSVATTLAASIPLLWVMPLALYLLTFVIAFSGARSRPLLWGAAVLVLFFLFYAVTLVEGEDWVTVVLAARILILFALMFFACLMLHGEMADLRPGNHDIGGYYLLTTFGGALGGAFIVFAAPLIFDDFWEFESGVLATLVLAGWPLLSAAIRRWGRAVSLAGAVAAASFAFAAHALHEEPGEIIQKVRNFYGVIKVASVDNSEGEDDGDTEPTTALFQANVNQGEQKDDPAQSMDLSCDFGPDSALGLALTHHPRRRAAGPAAPLRIGIIGLGAGMIAATGKPGDTLRYYEINPAVLDMAKEHFTFLEATASKVEVLLGDGRLLLEADMKSGQPKFDILVLDAFSGGAPPMHLLTREAFVDYAAMLNPDGLLLGNFEVETLDVSPLLRGQAKQIGMTARWFQSRRIKDCNWPGVVSWVTMTRDPGYFDLPAVARAVSTWPDEGTSELVWTDARSDLLSIVDW